MKNKIAIVVIAWIALLGGFSFDSNAADSMIKYQSFQAELNDKSDTLHKKFIYNYPIDVLKGEKIYIKCSSKDFAVSLCVRNQSGDTLGEVEVPQYYSDKGSYLSYLFEPQSTGKCQLLFTSKDIQEKGKFKVNYARFNPDGFPFDDNGEFCTLLNYLVQQSATDFRFITKIPSQLLS